MAQTLRYLDELLGAAPDNTAGLISAEALRDFMVSMTQGSGFIADTTSQTLNIPLLDMPLSINPLLLAPTEVGAGWSTDGNNFSFPEYVAMPSTTIPPGYSKLATFVCVLSLEKITSQEDNYDVQFTEDGAPIGVPETIQFQGTGAQVVTVLTSRIVDVSAVPLYGVQISGIGTSDDLDLHSFEWTVNDRMMWEAP